MSRKKRYRELMEKARQAHREFAGVWSQTRDAELQKRNIDPQGNIWKSNPLKFDALTEKMWEANGVAYHAANPQSNKRKEFLNQLFEELPVEAFLEGQSEAIDAILDFVEIDVLAFRCGYAKEWLLHKLKPLRLTQKQKHRLERLTIEMCRRRGYGRELRHLARVMIHHADHSFIQQLKHLEETSSPYTRQKVQRVIQVILHNRPDLKS